MYFKGLARRGPTWREAILMHAVARLVLHPLVPNIQTSWVKMGLDGAAACLEAGANDLGGTLMNESISRAAGTQHGQEFPPEEMERLIRSIGRIPQQRTTAYGEVPAEESLAISVGQRDTYHLLLWIDWKAPYQSGNYQGHGVLSWSPDGTYVELLDKPRR